MSIVADVSQLEKGGDAKVSELVTQTEAGRKLGLNAWQVQRLITSGKLEAVRLPTGNRAVLRSSLERYRQGQK